MLKKGLVQLYTGNGKGKTTAALGLAMRAAGAGNKVVIYQFLKPAALELGERKAIEQSSLPIEIKAMDLPWDMKSSFEDEELMARTRAEIHKICSDIASDAATAHWDVIILDELAYCNAHNLADTADISNIIKNRHPQVEIVITGRDAQAQLRDLSDYVCEISSRKHPFDSGILARKGIEY